MREGPPGARAVGDPNMASRGKIDPSLADSWLKSFDHRLVSDETKELAKEFGYHLDNLPLPPISKVSDALNLLWDTARNIEVNIQVPQELDALEGRRFLMRMLSASIDFFVEYNDVNHPVFHHAESATKKMFADCPDADYLRAAIRFDQGQVYRLQVQLPENTTYLGIMLYRQGGQTGQCIDDSQLILDQNRQFEVLISTSKKPETANSHIVYLTAEGDETAVIVRQYFTDRTTQPPATVSIRLANKTPLPPILNAEILAKNITLAQRMLTAVFKRTIEAYQIVTTKAMKRFLTLSGEHAQLFPTSDNVYQVCWYRIGHNQLMLVRGHLPKARYFAFTLYNAWMESFDYHHHQISLNHQQIQVEEDGHFEICLAHRDLKHHNWLDTAGHLSGYLIARTLLPNGELAEFSTETLYETEWQGNL